MHKLSFQPEQRWTCHAVANYSNELVTTHKCFSQTKPRPDIGVRDIPGVFVFVELLETGMQQPFWMFPQHK